MLRNGCRVPPLSNGSTKIACGFLLTSTGGSWARCSATDPERRTKSGNRKQSHYRRHTRHAHTYQQIVLISAIVTWRLFFHCSLQPRTPHSAAGRLRVTSIHGSCDAKTGGRGGGRKNETCHNRPRQKLRPCVDAGGPLSVQTDCPFFFAPASVPRF